MQRPTVIKSLIFLFVWLILATRPCGAGIDDETWTDSYLDKMNDWIVSVDVSTMKRFLDYPTSGFKPVANVVVRYRLVPRGNNRDVDPRPVRYEDIWYHNGTPIGLKRYHVFGIPKDKIGCISVKASSEMYEHTRTIANTVVRLLLDIDLKSAVITDVIVPREIYDAIASDLGQFRFFSREELRGDAGQQLLLHMVSNPRGIDKYFLFDKGDNAAR
jgi:hypothetical protein